jgi:hydroxymethylpyrimidine/phosphomethylpyrimidine kinase
VSSFHPELGVPVALFLGGLDPSGGAGILRDSMVASDFGIHTMAVPMAETVQNGFECREISPPAIDPAQRLYALKPHLCGNWGVKLSMFHDCSHLQSVLPLINQLGPSASIWDPIMSPTNGAALHCPTSIREAADMLSSKSWAAAPNIPEARMIANMSHEPIEAVAKKIFEMGFQSVWIRGGHSDGETVQDLWCDRDGAKWLAPNARLDGDPRGTGCTASAAWLAYRLTGMEPINAAEAAVQYIRKAWNNLHTPGKAGRPTFPPRIN